MHFYSRRSEYGHRLDQFLSKANQSIEVFTTSLFPSKPPAEWEEMLDEKLSSNPAFFFRACLLNPTLDALRRFSQTFAEDSDLLAGRIDDSNKRILRLQARYGPMRVRLSWHDGIPTHSIYALDGDTAGGAVHIETRLAMEPKSEAIGFRMFPGTEMYSRSLKSCRGLLDRSEQTSAISRAR